MKTMMPTLAVLANLTADDLMTREVVSIDERATLREAIATLTDHGFSGLPVINDAGRAVGVISQSDVVAHDRNRVEYADRVPEYYKPSELRAAADDLMGAYQVEVADRTRVRDVMTPLVFSVRPEAPLRLVVEEMMNFNVHRLFVVDDNGVLVGVIATTDILRRLVDSFLTTEACNGCGQCG